MGLFSRKALTSATHQFYFSAREKSPLMMTQRLEAYKGFFTGKWKLVEHEYRPFIRKMHAPSLQAILPKNIRTVKARGLSLAEVFNAMASYEEEDKVVELNNIGQGMVSLSPEADGYNIDYQAVYEDFMHGHMGLARDRRFHHVVKVPDNDPLYWKTYRQNHNP